MADVHTCALITDTSVKCFGYNAYGQLGMGDTANRLLPTAVPGLTGVVQLSLGGVSPTLLSPRHAYASRRPTRSRVRALTR